MTDWAIDSATRGGFRYAPKMVAPTAGECNDARRALRRGEMKYSDFQWLLPWLADQALSKWWGAFEKGKRGENLLRYAYPDLGDNTVFDVRAVDLRTRSGALVEVKTCENVKCRSTHFVAEINRDTGEPDGPWRAVSKEASYFVKIQACNGDSGKPVKIFCYDATAFRDRCIELIADGRAVRKKEWESGRKWSMKVEYFRDLELDHESIFA